MNLKGRNFLTLKDFTPEEITYMIDLAADLKAKKKAGELHEYYRGKNIALIFEKTSTRTRCSFEVAAHDLGMGSTYLDPTGSQIGKKESIADTARVLGRMYEGIEYRGFGQDIVEELAKHAGVPVWNGLTNEYHPTQMLADMLTVREHFGKLKGLKLVYMGDARYNMGNSLMVVCSKLGLDFVACTNKKYFPNDELVAQCQQWAKEAGSTITLTEDVEAGTKDADIIYTDVARRGNGLRNSECLPSSQIHSCQLRQNYNKKEIPPTYNNKTFFNPYHFSKKGDTHMVNQKYLDKAEVLIEALPYIQRFNRKIVVIKYGGSAMLDEELKRNVIKDAVLLKLVGFKPIIVHGGGKEISRWVGKVGMEPHFVNGLRVTDKDTMEIAEMVLAKVNKELVTLVESLGVQAVGVSGKDGGLLQCKKKLSKGEDIGYVGEVTKVNPKILHDLLERDFLPIVFPIGFDENFDSYNINADDAACAIAEAVEAEKLAFLSDIEGVYRDADDPSTLISELRVDEAENLISDGTVGGGMIPKLKNCIDAIEHGVNRVHILDGRIPHSLLLEIFTNKGIGTAILKDDGEKYYNEHE